MTYSWKIGFARTFGACHSFVKVMEHAYKAMMYLDLPLPLDANHHQYYYIFSGESVKNCRIFPLVDPMFLPKNRLKHPGFNGCLCLRGSPVWNHRASAGASLFQVGYAQKNVSSQQVSLNWLAWFLKQEKCPHCIWTLWRFPCDFMVFSMLWASALLVETGNW